MTMTPASRGGRTTAAVRSGDRPSPGTRNTTPGETRDARTGRPAADPADRPEHLTTGGGATTPRAVRPSDLTSRDIEADILTRLERRGYRWAGTPGRRRGAPRGAGRRA